MLWTAANLSHSSLFGLPFLFLLFVTGTWVPILFAAATAWLFAAVTRLCLYSRTFARAPTDSCDACVLLTGASSGIGRDAALALVQDGFTVYATVRSSAAATSLLAAVPAHSPGRLVPVQLDLLDAQQLTDAVRTVRDDLRRSHTRALVAIVNNAGYGEAGPIELTPVDRVTRQLAVNVVAVVAVTQAFVPLLRERGGVWPEYRRRVLFTSSIGGSITLPFTAVYNASKHAVEALAAGLRVELAPWHIDAVLVKPGAIVSEFARTMAQAKDANTRLNDDDDVERTALQHQYAQHGADVDIAGVAEKLGAAPSWTTTCAMREALLARRPLARYWVGVDAVGLRLVHWVLPDSAFDAVLRVMQRFV